MAGDNGVRSLLEKMAECASNAYLGILERYSFASVLSSCNHNFVLKLQLPLPTCYTSLVEHEKLIT